MSPWIIALFATMQEIPLRRYSCPSTTMVNSSTVGRGLANAAAKYAACPMAALLGSAASMSWASKPVPDMRPKPFTCSSPCSSFQEISPRSTHAVWPTRHARARAAGSGALPMFAKRRFAVPEGNTQTGTERPRSAWRSPVTDPSPPESTQTSKSSTSRTTSSATKSGASARKVHSSPAWTRARSNSKMASEPKPDNGLWMMTLRMMVLPGPPTRDSMYHVPGTGPRRATVTW